MELRTTTEAGTAAPSGDDQVLGRGRNLRVIWVLEKLLDDGGMMKCVQATPDQKQS